ncbi:hypothetical protein IT774_00995 [Salinimonas marina]|uniref:Uncharacterized protein n=1 Tax=Salinimonas marina TaxID=2785918 RepID=A0A7S9DXM6_9ALTE|nr:hypothetical protein [Salinimonas marina]QPG05877.1 hypothetical protein IT774_00995 [Salinimonas marina]
MGSKSSLSDLVKQLPQEKTPTRDLWQGIELALEHESQPHYRRNRSRLWLASAAAVLLTAGVVSQLWQSPATESTPAPLLGDALVRALSEQHQAQLTQMLVTLQDTTPVTSNWQQQLEDLQQAENVIKQALQQDPNNTALLQMLQNVHQQQLLLVGRVHAPKWQRI